MSKILKYSIFTIFFIMALMPYGRADEPVAEVSIEALPPSVVKTIPQCGDDSVDPSLTEISVTFSKEMKVVEHCWSWCSISEESFPQTTGSPEFKPDKRTCVLPVKLEPEKTYAIWFNVDQFKSFQDPEAHPSVPYLLVFKTGPEKESK